MEIIYTKRTFFDWLPWEKIFLTHQHSWESDISEGLGTRPFDGEGVKTFTKSIVESEVLDTYLLDTYSAKQLELKSTTNGYSNIYIKSSKSINENIIESLEEGYW